MRRIKNGKGGNRFKKKGVGVDKCGVVGILYKAVVDGQSCCYWTRRARGGLTTDEGIVGLVIDRGDGGIR